MRLQQRPEGGAGESRAETHGRPFQTEGKAGAKALRQEPGQVLEAQGGAPCGRKRQLGVIEMERWGGESVSDLGPTEERRWNPGRQ